MSIPPSSGLSREELLYRLSLHRADGIISIVKSLIKYGALVACFYFVYLSILALSGKATLATIGLSVLGNIKVSEGICALLTGGSILYGVGQRQLRHRVIRRIGTRLSELEKERDPERSSSGLTDTGGTRPEDNP